MYNRLDNLSIGTIMIGSTAVEESDSRIKAKHEKAIYRKKERIVRI